MYDGNLEPPDSTGHSAGLQSAFTSEVTAVDWQKADAGDSIRSETEAKQNEKHG